MLTLNGQMDSRFRANDTVEFLEASPEVSRVLALPVQVYTTRNVIASEAWRSRFSIGVERRDCFVVFTPRNDN